MANGLIGRCFTGATLGETNDLPGAYARRMGKIAIGVALAFGTLVLALALQDPLAAGSLTASQRAAGFRSADIEVNGENCRFCRINIEQALKAVPGVKVAKADMTHHRARVVYDPLIAQPADFMEAVRAEDRPGGREAPSMP